MELANIIKQSIDTTYNKHNKYYSEKKITIGSFSEGVIKGIIHNQDYKLFTSSNNARSNMRAIGRDALMVELIKGAYLTYTVETSLGYARQHAIVGKNGYPEDAEQAVNYIFDKLTKQQHPVNIYNELQDIRSTNLVNHLIKNYSHLVNNFTQQQIMESYHIYAPYLQENLNMLDELQNSLIVAPNQLTNDNTTLLGY